MSATIDLSEVRTNPDRRMAPRVAARFPAKLHCLQCPDAVTARSSDVGPGGVCVETQSAFDPSSLRRISIALPPGTVEAKAIAQWQRRNAAGTGILTGVSLRELDSRTTATLSSFVHERARELSGFLLDRSEVTGLQLDEALDLALFTRVAEFPSSSRIYEQNTQGTSGDSVFVVFDGTILLAASAPDGGEVQIEQICMGGVFGGLPLIGETPHTESAIALSDAILLEIDPYTFSFLQTTKPHVVNRLRVTLIRKKALQLKTLIERME